MGVAIVGVVAAVVGVVVGGAGVGAYHGSLDP